MGGNKLISVGATLHIIQNQIKEWTDLDVVDVVEEVEATTLCKSFSHDTHEGKPGHRLCHDLRMLNIVTKRPWRPPIDRL